jgi:hypothetical protein
MAWVRHSSSRGTVVALAVAPPVGKADAGDDSTIEPRGPVVVEPAGPEAGRPLGYDGELDHGSRPVEEAASSV